MNLLVYVILCGNLEVVEATRKANKELKSPSMQNELRFFCISVKYVAVQDVSKIAALLNLKLLKGQLKSSEVLMESKKHVIGERNNVLSNPLVLTALREAWCFTFACDASDKAGWLFTAREVIR